jgi:PAS domain S-box-containing protein
MGFMLIWFRRQGWRRYGLPVTSVAIATGLRFLFAPFTHEGGPFLLFFAAVMVSSYYGLKGSGMVAGILAALVGSYFFIRPYNQFAIQSIGDLAEIAGFLFESAVICAGVMKLKESRQNAQVSQFKIAKQQRILEQMNTDLEQQVQERTQKLEDTNAALKARLIEHEQIEIALIESERRLELALESSGDGWWDWDISAGTFNLSTQWLKMLGYKEGELPRNMTVWRRLTHPDDLPWVMETLWAHLKDPTDSLYRFDYRVLSKSGEWRWIANYGKAVAWDAKGKPTRMVGMHRDITDRKVAEQELLKSEYILRSFFESTSMMIGVGEVVEDDILFISVNNAMAEFVDLTPEKMQNLRFSQTGVPQEIVQLWIACFRESQQTKCPAHFEYEYRTTNGLFWLSATVCEVQKVQDRSRLSFIVEDITLRKQTEACVAASLQEKEVLLKEIHHRVKNNLQVICSLLNLQARSMPSTVLSEQLKESQNRVRSMALVHEMLYQADSLSKINLHEYVMDLIKHLSRSYTSTTISLNTEVSQDIFLDIDTAILCGLIINELISNSFKHAFEQHCSGEINIKGFLDSNDSLVLTVQDNGRGLPADWSLERNKTLGLELVKDLAEQLKAKIQIDSIDGVRFEIIFPIQIN